MKRYSKLSTIGKRKKSATFSLMTFVKLPIICGPKYNRVFLVFTGLDISICCWGVAEVIKEEEVKNIHL